MLGLRYSCFSIVAKHVPRYTRVLTVRPQCISGDYLRTNVMADYLDKLSTDVNCITYTEEADDDMCYIQVVVVVGILMYMFMSENTKEK